MVCRNHPTFKFATKISPKKISVSVTLFNFVPKQQKQHLGTITLRGEIGNHPSFENKILLWFKIFISNQKTTFSPNCEQIKWPKSSLHTRTHHYTSPRVVGVQAKKIRLKSGKTTQSSLINSLVSTLKSTSMKRPRRPWKKNAKKARFRKLGQIAIRFDLWD